MIFQQKLCSESSSRTTWKLKKRFLGFRDIYNGHLLWFLLQKDCAVAPSSLIEKIFLWVFPLKNIFWKLCWNSKIIWFLMPNRPFFEHFFQSDFWNFNTHSSYYLHTLYLLFSLLYLIILFTIVQSKAAITDIYLVDSSLFIDFFFSLFLGFCSPVVFSLCFFSEILCLHETSRRRYGFWLYFASRKKWNIFSWKKCGIC